MISENDKLSGFMFFTLLLYLIEKGQIDLKEYQDFARRYLEASRLPEPLKPIIRDAIDTLGESKTLQ